MLVKIENLSKNYQIAAGQAVPVLRTINIGIEKGEFAVIMGPSGSGKSTLLQLIGGLDRPSSGSIEIDGQDLARLAEADRTLFRRRKLGFIFQSFHLLPLLTAEENVALPLVLDGVSRPEALKKARELLTRVARLEHRMDHRPHQLSGGEKQRVAIARSLVASPALILADEPTGALDSKSGTLVLEILRDICRDEGKTIVMVTHDEGAAKYGTRVIRVLDGVIAADKKTA